MGKKKKKINTDNVLFLCADGRVKSVHRSKIIEEYKYEDSEVEFILIPLTDGLQYIMTKTIPKKFKSLKIEFDLYVMNEAALHEHKHMPYSDYAEDPIYAKITHYEIECDDLVEYFRFMQSIYMTTAIPSMMEDADMAYTDEWEFFRTLSFEIVNVRYSYTNSKGHKRSGALEKKGVIPRHFRPEEFIESVVRLVHTQKELDNVYGPFGIFNCGTDNLIDYSDTIIIDVVTSQWTLVPEFYERTVVNKMVEILDNHKRASVYSPLSNTFIFEGYEHITAYLNVDELRIGIGTFVAVVDSKRGDNDLASTLMDAYGFDYTDTIISLASLVDGEFKDMFDYCYSVFRMNEKRFSSAEADIELMVDIINSDRIRSVFNMINNVIFGSDAFAVFQVSAEFDYDQETCKPINDFNFVTLCEDNNISRMFDKTMYDRFTEDMVYIHQGELPPRLEYVDPRLLGESPIPRYSK